MKITLISNYVLVACATIGLASCGGDSAPAKHADPKVQAALEKGQFAGTYQVDSFCDGKAPTAGDTFSVSVSNVDVVLNVHVAKAKNDQPCSGNIHASIKTADADAHELVVNKIAMTINKEPGCPTNPETWKPETEETASFIAKNGKHEVNVFGMCFVTTKR